MEIALLHALVARTSNLAASLAVKRTQRQMPPFTYLPNATRFSGAGDNSEASLRSAGHELSRILEYAGHALSADVVSGLSSTILRISESGHLSAEDFGAVSVALCPDNMDGHLVLVAQLIRKGRLCEAERRLSALSRRAIRPSDRSRIFANLATVHELAGDLAFAKRASKKSVCFSEVCSLALYNYRQYHG